MDVARRVARIRERIAAACARAGRSPDEVVLIGAGKRQSLDRLQAALDAGLEVLGENRVQEAAAKRPLLTGCSHWSLIGPLQSNKVNKAVELFDSVHSIDRIKIARALERSASQRGRRLMGLLEINLGEEASKSGFSPQGLAGRVAELAELEAVRIEGLMAIPPPSAEPAGSRAWFRELRGLRDEFFSREEWSGRAGYLSMGMSGDFEVAIEEGATHVRVGTALFGPRPPVG